MSERGQWLVCAVLAGNELREARVAGITALILSVVFPQYRITGVKMEEPAAANTKDMEYSTCYYRTYSNKRAFVNVIEMS